MARDLVGGVLAITIGAGYFLLALQIRTSALSDSVGAAGFPKTLAIALIVLGMILCMQALLAHRSRRPASAAATAPPPDEDSDERVGGRRQLAGAGGMLLLGIGYLLIVRALGYVVSVALLMIATTLYLGTPFSWRVPIIGIAGAVAYGVVFVWRLGIPLPAGPFGNLF